MNMPRFHRNTLLIAFLLVGLTMGRLNQPAGAADEGAAKDAPAFRLGIMTSTGLQSREELRGAQEMVRLYGDAAKGGLVRHVTYPDNFLEDIETTVARLLELAADPLMKVIIVSQAVPGTADAFRLIKEKRPDIFRLAGEPQEDIKVIAEVADLVVASDFVSRGYLLPHSARKLGAGTFVHISFPRHMIDEGLARRRTIMEEACRDLGLKFVFVNAPDPLGSAGVEGARQFILDQFPAWLEEYGPKTAFFSTNEAHVAPLVRQIATHGGYFVEADMPSPLLGFPEALGLNLEKAIEDDWPEILRRIEAAVLKAGAGGRLGTWAYSLGFSQTAALAEFGKLLAEGRTKLDDRKALLNCFEKFSPGSKWNGENYLDPGEGRPLGNYLLIYQDTYVFGLGYLGAAELKVPEKYWRLQDKAAAKRPESPAFHIGIATGSGTQEAQGSDDFLGALEMIRIYGEADRGGLIRHVIYPDQFMDDPKKTRAVIAGLADDPLLKVIVVNQAIPGTAEAFHQIRARRPDILLLAGEVQEDPDEIAPAADLVVAADFINRGYLIPHSARRLGAKNLVHISFPRHLGYEGMGRRRAIMAQACDDLGLRFADEEAPDPTGKIGVEGAQEFILKKYPEWLRKYGPETAFFATNDAHTEPLIRQVADLGGLFVEADLPSLLLGFPEALELDIKSDSGNWPEIMRQVEAEVKRRGAEGRLGTWAYPLGFCQTAGLAEFGKLVVEGRARLADTDLLLESFSRFAPGAKWNGSYYTDAVTGKPIRNFFQIYQDTYILGLGYLNTTDVEIPDRYFTIRKEK